MSRRPAWEAEGRDWPHRRASRFVKAGGLTWHVQMMGRGPALVLLHGTGAATHSWRGLLPLLVADHQVVAMDLPGHGFTSPPSRPSDYSLPAVSRAVGALLDNLEVAPLALIGHSAGAAIAARMSLDGRAAPRAIISLNGAFLPFPGLLGPWAPSLAKMLFFNPFTIALFAQRAAQPGAIKRLIEGTGSALDPESLGFYERLFRKPGHLEGALGLMAHWDLYGLKQDLPRLGPPVTLIAADKDRAVPPKAAREVAALIPGALVRSAAGLGHLAHEEQPDLIAGLIRSALPTWG